MKVPTVGFAGMTHLGLVSGVCSAEKGFKTVLFDRDEARIGALGRHELPVSEPRLQELIRRTAPCLEFSSTAADLARCDLIYVAEDVPTEGAGWSDLKPIDALLEIVMHVAREDATVVVLSQVPPGFTRAKQRAGRNLFYQVETLIFGRAVERALIPERFIVGCAEPSQPLPAAYQDFLAAYGCPILRMRYESAELAKISINLCLVASLTTANTLAELCEQIGADWSEIVPALKLDKRIGEHAYLAPGLGIGGGNLERDLATVIRLCEQHGTDAAVVKACVANSAHRRDWAVRLIREKILDANPRATVAVWGLAYKENTHSVKNSPSLAAIAQLGDAVLRLHDPVVPASAARHPRAQSSMDPLEAASGADALMILTPWPEYRAIAASRVAAAMRGRTVLDPYAVLDAQAAAAAGLDLYSLGRGSTPRARSV